MMFARFEVFVAVKIQVKVIWVVTLHTAVVEYQHFRGSRCHHFQGDMWCQEADLGIGEEEV
jgi:hypothetical protein